MFKISIKFKSTKTIAGVKAVNSQGPRKINSLVLLSILAFFFLGLRNAKINSINIEKIKLELTFSNITSSFTNEFNPDN